MLPFTDLDTPYYVAVDNAGNVYVADARFGGNASNRVLKLPAGSNTQVELPFGDLGTPGGLAVDSAGNVYVSDFGGRVLKLPAS